MLTGLSGLYSLHVIGTRRKHLWSVQLAHLRILQMYFCYCSGIERDIVYPVYSLPGKDMRLHIHQDQPVPVS